MGAVMERLERRAEDTARAAKQAQRVLELAQEVGEDGLSELLALLNADEPNGNGHHKKADGPRGRAAVRLIVAERPGVWTLTELRAAMVERGWFTSQKGLEAAVKRLCRLDGEGRGLGSGRYVFPANHGEEEPRESAEPGAGMIAPYVE